MFNVVVGLICPKPVIGEAINNSNAKAAINFVVFLFINLCF